MGGDNWAADSWVDYGLRHPSKGEKKRGERRRRKWWKGVCWKGLLCDAAAGWFWPSKEEGGLLSCLAREATPDPLHAPPCSRCKPSLLSRRQKHTDTQAIFFSHSARTYRGNCVRSGSRLHPICSIFLLAIFWGQSSKPGCLDGGAVEVIWKLISFKNNFSLMSVKEEKSRSVMVQ